MGAATIKKAVLTTMLAATLVATAAFGTEPTPCETAYLASGEETLVSFEQFASHHADGPCATAETAGMSY